MRLRAVILDDNAGIRQALWALCDRPRVRGLHLPRTRALPAPRHRPVPVCPGITCADIILSDLNMPQVQGLDFVETLVAKRCAAPHIGLMSGAWSAADEARAVRLGCRLFHKPFSSPTSPPGSSRSRPSSRPTAGSWRGTRAGGGGSRRPKALDYSPGCQTEQNSRATSAAALPQSILAAHTQYSGAGCSIADRAPLA